MSTYKVSVGIATTLPAVIASAALAMASGPADSASISIICVRKPVSRCPHAGQIPLKPVARAALGAKLHETDLRFKPILDQTHFREIRPERRPLRALRGEVRRRGRRTIVDSSAAAVGRTLFVVGGRCDAGTLDSRRSNGETLGGTTVRAEAVF